MLCDAVGWDSITNWGGAAGRDSVDAAMARRMLTGYGKASVMLYRELVEWAQWLANKSAPWAAYRGMTTRRLLGLDKEPGIRPVGIGSYPDRCLTITNILWTAVVREGEWRCCEKQARSKYIIE